VYELSVIRHERSCRTNYEIHVRTNSGWGVSASRGEMTDAIGAAQQALRQTGAQAVRVVRDVYDPAAGTSKMTTVFRAAATESDHRATGFRPMQWINRARALAAAPISRRRQVAGSLAVSLVGFGCGTVLNWLRS
jgi:hypothetical protein